MEQSGEPAESEQPGSEAPRRPLQPTDGGASTDRPRALLITAVLALVVVIAAAAWSARPDGLAVVDRQEERFPPPTTLAPPTTAAVPSTTPATAAPSAVPTSVLPTTLPPTVPPTPVPTTAPPAPTTVPAAPPTSAPPAAPPASAAVPPVTTAPGEEPDDPAEPPDEEDPYIARLVPNVAAFAEAVATPELAAARIDELLASGRHEVATPGPAAAVCAAVRLDRPLAIRGRWERDGRRVASSDLERRDSPGFGECLTDDGDALADGSYQYIATDTNGNESAAGGIVVGAARVEQRFRNDASTTVCTVRIAPSTSRYFEVYVFTASPVQPGAEVTLPVAAVEQDVETLGCDGDELAAFSFDPAPDVVVPLAE